jgi:RHH-type proline utilization regulon transcriptional repressor/proline dehydrogenase/delta 1-pyrroline-5-carboxylate dehydrogenase
MAAGNIYINRNIIGAVVGSQPFGGHTLSGTGPKAGGPLYIKRLLASGPPLWPKLARAPAAPAALSFVEWLRSDGRAEMARLCDNVLSLSRLGAAVEMPGPVGEKNIYRLRPAGTVLCHVATPESAILAVACALATGNRPALAGPAGRSLFDALPSILRGRALLADGATKIDVALTDAQGRALTEFLQEMASRDGPIVSVHALPPARQSQGELWPSDFLLNEQSISINTTAAGGNASLMSIG